MTQQELKELENARDYFQNLIPIIRYNNFKFKQNNNRLSYWINDEYTLVIFFKKYDTYTAYLANMSDNTEIRVSIFENRDSMDAINQIMNQIINKVKNNEWVNEDE